MVITVPNIQMMYLNLISSLFSYSWLYLLNSYLKQYNIIPTLNIFHGVKEKKSFISLIQIDVMEEKIVIYI